MPPDGQIDLHEEAARQRAETMTVPDSGLVTQRATALLDGLYGTGDYYAIHTAGILRDYPRFAGREIDSEEGQIVAEIDRNTRALHDVLGHLILHPQQAAARLGFNPDVAPLVAVDIKESAITEVNKMFEEVTDTDGLMKAYLFANDASHWEAAAQMWRAEITDRVLDMVNADKPADRMDRRSGEILLAIINKTPDLDRYDETEIAGVLQREGRRLIGVKFSPLSEATKARNIRGLPAEGEEYYWNITHPPKGNLASTARDGIEAINFIVPGLYAFEYDTLATELRGAVLELFYPDPNGDAERQHRDSEQYFPELEAIIAGGLQEPEFGRVKLEEFFGRVKTNGSLRQKLASPGYEHLHQAPDGNAFSPIVSNETELAETVHFARSYQRWLTSADRPFNIEARHPKGREDRHTFEVHNEAGVPGEYQAIHMTFYYYPEGGPADGVPFEIQILTQEQSKLKRFDENYTDLRYKGGKPPVIPGDQEDLNHMQKRGKAEHTTMPASTVQSIAEGVVTSPGLKPEHFVFNAFYQAVKTPGAGGVLVPHELGVAWAIADRLAKVAGEEDDLTLLPPTYLGEEQFVKALNLLGVDARKDQNVARALAFVKQSEAGNTRDDGETPIFEGHLLPTALMAVMLIKQSGKIWDSELSPTEVMSNVVTAALLHDTPEGKLDKLKKQGASAATILQKRREMLYDIAQQYGKDVAEAVDAMTLHVEIEDEETRREQASRDVLANEIAKYAGKPADRGNNHMADLIQLATGQARPGSALYQRKMTYARKTDRQLFADFTAPDMPDAIRRMYYLMWELLKSFGYQPEAK
jgi:hypothetical protein